VGVRRPLLSTALKPFCKGWDLADSGNNSWRWLVLPAHWLAWLLLYQGVVGHHLQMLGQLQLLMPLIAFAWPLWFVPKTIAAFHSFWKTELVKTWFVQQGQKLILCGVNLLFMTVLEPVFLLGRWLLEVTGFSPRDR
jgi:hypothetical protein